MSEGSPAGEVSLLGTVSRALTAAWHAISALPATPYVAVAVVVLLAGALLLRHRRAGGSISLRPSRETLQRVLVSAVAATGAWMAAALVGSTSPAHASLLALLTVQVSFGVSFVVAGKTLLGTVVALVAAEVAMDSLGVGPLAVLATVVVTMLVGLRLEKQDPDKGVWVATTAVFALALGPSLNEATGVDRVLTLLLGACIGIMLGPLAHPSTVRGRALRALEQLAEAVSEVLDGVSSRPDGVSDLEHARGWLERSRELPELVAAATERVDDARGAARVWAFRSGEETDELVRRLRALSFAAEQANTIARSLFDAAYEGTHLPEEIVEAVDAAAGVVTAYASGTGLTTALNVAEIMQERARDELRGLDDTQALLLSGAVLTDVSRVVEQAKGTAPALDLDEAEVDVGIDSSDESDSHGDNLAERPDPGQDVVERLEERGWFR